MNIKYL